MVPPLCVFARSLRKVQETVRELRASAPRLRCTLGNVCPSVSASVAATAPSCTLAPPTAPGGTWAQHARGAVRHRAPQLHPRDDHESHHCLALSHSDADNSATPCRRQVVRACFAMARLARRNKAHIADPVQQGPAAFCTTTARFQRHLPTAPWCGPISDEGWKVPAQTHAEGHRVAHAGVPIQAPALVSNQQSLSNLLRTAALHDVASATSGLHTQTRSARQLGRTL